MIARNWLSAGRICVCLLVGTVLALSAAADSFANTFSGNIFKVAGGQRSPITLEEKTATIVRLGHDLSVAALPDGGFLIADPSYQNVYRASADGTIKVVAGRKTNCDHKGNYGDGGPAVDAQLNQPRGVALHPDGGFLIADSANNLIRRVLPDGTIIRVAGAVNAKGESKSGKYGGDDGPATQARLNFPTAVAMLPDGGFLIADSGNSLIRRVWPNGIITTVAGSVDRNGEGIEGYGGDGGAATDASLRKPEGVAVLSDGSFLIADTLNAAIRRVDREGTITLVAGSRNAFGSANVGHDGDGGPATNASLHHPTGIATLADGGYLLADKNNNVIRRVGPGPTGTITHFAGNPAGNQGDPAGENNFAANSGLKEPMTVAVSSDGRVLIADRSQFSGYSRVHLIDSDVRGRPSALTNPLNPAAPPLGIGQIATWVGNGTSGYAGDTLFASQAQLNHPQGIAVIPERRLKLANLPADHDMTEQGSVLVADTGNNRIRKVTSDGRIWTVAGTGEAGFMMREADGSWIPGDGQPATAAPLNSPTDVDTLPNGTFFIADRDNHLIRRVDASGNIHTVAGELAYTKARGGRVFGMGVSGYNGDKRAAVGASLAYPSGVTAFPDGTFLIADSDNHIIRKVDSTGVITTVAGVPKDPTILFGPERVIRARGGGLLIANTQGHNIVRKDPLTGHLERVAGIPIKSKSVGSETFNGQDGTPADRARLSAPVGLLQGNNGGLLFVDSFNSRIRQVRLKRTTRRTFSFPAIFNLIGNGRNALTGDFQPAVQASLDRPTDLDRHPEGLVIADTNNNVVRFVLCG